MKKKNENKIKKTKAVESTLIKSINDDTDQVKKFAIILVGVAIVALLLYLFSAKILIKDKIKKEDSKTTVSETIQYSSVDVGNVFNRPYDEYYVMAYDPDSLKASIYAALLSNFSKEQQKKKEEEKTKLYFLDLSNDINKAYVKEESNKNAKNAEELALKDPTLIKISKGKIEKYLENLEEIEKELK